MCMWYLVCSLSVFLSVNSNTLNPFQDYVNRRETLQKLETCFCQLQGKVEECCCEVETVDKLNKEQIFPILSPLMTKPFFKFYRVNLNRGCPFWKDDSRCVLQSCHVKECQEDQSYLWDSDSSESPPPQEACQEGVSQKEKVLSKIDTSISLEQQQEFEEWQEHDDSEDRFCDPGDDDLFHLSYVDLALNPERYTGYSGPSPHRIWKAIYEENCFKTDDESTLYGDLEGMCLEKRAFYRVISGLHASINVHLSAIYITNGQFSENPKFGPNLNAFVHRFDMTTTSNQGPIWLKNLYFVYLLVLRAVMKAENYWKEYQFYTGNSMEDIEVKRDVLSIVQSAKSCPSLFDETQMFSGASSEDLKAEFKSHFRNISRIMDCVGCDKCRLWGKVQVHGIGTALEILFNANGNSLKLKRNEVVALFNVLGRFSNSINHLQMFRRMLLDQQEGHIEL